MAIIADIVHRGVVYPDIYISPHSINSDSFYTLKYLVGGKGGPPLLGMEETMRSFTFNNSRAGLSKPDGAGIVFDRDVGSWPQVYADLKAKIAAGACPWITNVRDETDFKSRPPEIRTVEVEKIVERVVEVPMLSPNPVRHMIPEEIRNLMQEGESLSSAKRRLTELLWVEQAELRNLRGTDRENLKREAEIERLLGLFARLGEI